MDTKELQEVIEGTMELTIAVLEELADGIQVHDVVAIFAKIQANQDLREAIVKAARGANQVPSELKDLDGQEAIEIVMLMLPYIPKMIKALSRPASF